MDSSRISSLWIPTGIKPLALPGCLASLPTRPADLAYPHSDLTFSIGKPTVTFLFDSSVTLRTWLWRTVSIRPREDFDWLSHCFHFSTSSAGSCQGSARPCHVTERGRFSPSPLSYTQLLKCSRTGFLRDRLWIPWRLCKHSYGERAQRSPACDGTGFPAPVTENELERAWHTPTQPTTRSRCSLRMPMSFGGQKNLLRVSKFSSVPRE